MHEIRSVVAQKRVWSMFGLGKGGWVEYWGGGGGGGTNGAGYSGLKQKTRKSHTKKLC